MPDNTLQDLRDYYGTAAPLTPADYKPVANPYNPPSKTWSQLATEYLPLLGAIGGSIAGGVVARSPSGVAAGSSIGQRLGATLFSPAAVRQYATQAGGAATGGLAGEQAASYISTGKPMTAAYAMEKALEYAATDAAGNAVFRFGGELIKIPLEKLGRHFGPSTNQEKIRLAQQYLQKQGVPGATLTSWQAREGAGASGLEGILRSAPTSAGVFEKQAKATVHALQVGRNNLLATVDDISFDPTYFHSNLADVVEGGSRNLSKIVGPYYDNLDQYGVKVNLSAAQADAANELAHLKSLTKSGKPSTLGTDPAIITKMEELLDLKPAQGFKVVHEQLSGIKKLIRDQEVEFGKNNTKVVHLKKLVIDLEQAMDDSAKQIGKPEVYEQYRNVAGYYRDMLNNLYTDGLAVALKKNPDQVGSAIFSNTTALSAQDVMKSIRTARSLTESPAEADALLRGAQRGFLEKMLGSAEKDISEEGLRASIRAWRKNPANENIAKALLDPVEIRSLEKFINAAEISSKLPSSKFSLFATSRQFSSGVSALAAAGGAVGTVYGVATSDMETTLKSLAGAGAVLLTPPAVAKVLTTNPRHINRLLTLEAKANKTGIAGGIIAQLASLYNDAGVTVEDLNQPTLQQNQLDEFRQLYGTQQ